MLQIQIKEENSWFLCGQIQRTPLFNLSNSYIYSYQVQSQGQLFKSNSHINFLLWHMLKMCFQNHATACRQIKHFDCSLPFPKLSADRWTKSRQTCFSLHPLRSFTEHQCGEIPADKLQRTTTEPLLCKIRYSLVWWRRQNNEAWKYWFIQNLVWSHI